MYITLHNFVKYSALLIETVSHKWNATLIGVGVVWALWMFQILILSTPVLMSSKSAKKVVCPF